MDKKCKQATIKIKGGMVDEAKKKMMAEVKKIEEMWNDLANTDFSAKFDKWKDGLSVPSADQLKDKLNANMEDMSADFNKGMSDLSKGATDLQGKANALMSQAMNPDAAAKKAAQDAVLKMIIAMVPIPGIDLAKTIADLKAKYNFDSACSIEPPEINV